MSESVLIDKEPIDLINKYYCLFDVKKLGGFGRDNLTVPMHGLTRNMTEEQFGNIPTGKILYNTVVKPAKILPPTV